MKDKNIIIEEDWSKYKEELENLLDDAIRKLKSAEVPADLIDGVMEDFATRHAEIILSGDVDPDWLIQYKQAIDKIAQGRETLLNLFKIWFENNHA